jgi:hypothetical protein
MPERIRLSVFPSTTQSASEEVAPKLEGECVLQADIFPERLSRLKSHLARMNLNLLLAAPSAKLPRVI